MDASSRVQEPTLLSEEGGDCVELLASSDAESLPKRWQLSRSAALLLAGMLLLAAVVFVPQDALSMRGRGSDVLSLWQQGQWSWAKAHRVRLAAEAAARAQAEQAAQAQAAQVQAAAAAQAQAQWQAAQAQAQWQAQAQASASAASEQAAQEERERAAAAAAAAAAKHQAFLQDKWATEGLIRWQGEHSCPAQLAGVDVQTQVGLKTISYVRTAADCQKACTETEGCDAFAWGYQRNLVGLTDNCYLKAIADNETAVLDHNPGIMSGYPCNISEEHKFWWPDNLPERFTLPAPAKARNLSDLNISSLLCIALMQPYSYEQGLLTMQYNENASIFGCDRSVVYSSQAIELAPNLTSRRIPSSLKCEIGGQFGTALNTEIFLGLWRAVIEDGDYMNYSWLVKADPDAVFFPKRLAPLLSKYEYGIHDAGIYLENCGDSLHGPIEVFSQNAIRSLAKHAIDCYWAFTGTCHGPGDCNWGEDSWIDQCFRRFTGVKHEDVWQLLAEDHCNPIQGWWSCTDWNRVAFHPFKDVVQYKACVDRAKQVRP